MNTEARHAVLGVVASFKSPDDIIQVACIVKKAGYKKFDVHTPYPVHGMDRAMGLKPSILGWVAGLAGFCGAVGAMAFQCWTSGVDYRIVTSGKPFLSYEAFVPITFELAILATAFATVFGMFILNGLPKFHHSTAYSRSYRGHRA